MLSDEAVAVVVVVAVGTALARGFVSREVVPAVEDAT
jgi:hypothetical protein